MKPEYLDQLNAWYHEEVDALKANGATEPHFKEPVFAQLVIKKIIENHSDEIPADQEFAESVFLMMFDKASPSTLRRMAAQEREQGNLDIAYNLEVIADQRERANWPLEE
jgi:hypothetical protein